MHYFEASSLVAANPPSFVITPIIELVGLSPKKRYASFVGSGGARMMTL